MAVVALAAVGGIGFAASTAVNSAKVKIEKVSSGSARTVAVSAVRNAASDQYVDSGRRVTQPGPPQLTVEQRKDASGNPIPVVAKATKGNPDVTLNTSLTVNESGTLSVQVLDADGAPVNIDCKRSTVQGDSFPGTGEAKICRVVINTPARLQILIKVPSRQLDSGEELTIRLGYTDRDASAKRTVVDTPAKAPAKLPTVTRTFRLSDEDIKDIREARADGTLFSVTFRAVVSKERTSVSITWGPGDPVTGTTVGTREYSRAADVPRTATVTVVGGEIGGGDFTVKDTDTVAVIKITASKLNDGIHLASYSFTTSMAISPNKYDAIVLDKENRKLTAQAMAGIQNGEWSWAVRSSQPPVSPVKIRFSCIRGQCSEPARFSELLPTK